MTYYQFDIGPRGRKAGRFIGRVRKELLEAITEEMRTTNVTVDDLARKLNVPRSVLNRQLEGGTGLTLRALADLAWALDRDITFGLTRRAKASGQNSGRGTTTPLADQIKIVGGRKPGSSTLPYPAQTRVAPRSNKIS